MTAYNINCKFCDFDFKKHETYCTETNDKCLKELCPHRNFLHDAVDDTIKIWGNAVPSDYTKK